MVNAGSTDVYFMVNDGEEQLNLKIGTGGVDVNDELIDFLMKEGLPFKLTT